MYSKVNQAYDPKMIKIGTSGR